MFVFYEAEVLDDLIENKKIHKKVICLAFTLKLCHHKILTV